MRPTLDNLCDDCIIIVFDHRPESHKTSITFLMLYPNAMFIKIKDFGRASTDSGELWRVIIFPMSPVRVHEWPKFESLP